MRKLSKKAIGLLLVIVLCISIVPISAMATDETPVNDPGENALPIEPDGNAVPAEPSASASPAAEPADFEPTWPEATELSITPEKITGEPSYTKNVKSPFVQVVYNYFDEEQNTVVSTHSYDTLAVVNNENITIAANKFPGNVPVSTDASRFRVLLNGNEDITAQASYDAATGFVSLPLDFANSEIAVVWNCPAPEMAELTVTTTIGVFGNGQSEVTEQRLTLPSDANSIEIPLAGVDRIVVNQNGLDLQPDEYSLNDGILTIHASALGGDLVVSAFPERSAVGFSAMAANATTVNHERQHYNSVNYGYVTSYYVANGNVAYCLDPTMSGVNTGSYDISGYMERGTGNDNIIKSAWYLYQCPGEDSGLFSGLDWEYAYGYSHVAASYIYLEAIGGDTGKAWKGIENNTTTQNAIMNMVNTIKGNPMPPNGFKVFLYNVGNQTSQSLMGWEYSPTGDLEIQKVSGDPDKTDGNSCYSLQGAVFGVYNGSDEKIGTITTDGDGKGKLTGIDAGQTGLYILEEKPPAGYAENTAKIPFEIVSGQTTSKIITNAPQGDPVTILLKKLDGETNTNTAQGSATLAGAQFTIKYYKGDYTGEELNGKTPARKWIVQTNKNGFAMLHQDFLVSGSDPLYYASNGTTPTIPLGTVAIQETKAPTGFLINDEVFIRYSRTSGTREAVNTYNEPIVKESVIRGRISIEKWDFELNRKAVPQGDAALAGAVLAIYNRNAESVEVNGKSYAPGAVVHSIKTDATGTATTASDLLPYGDYEIIETTAPTGYLNTGVIKQTFKIKDDGVIVNLKTSGTTIKNDVARGGVEIEKFDIERDQSALKQGDAMLTGAVLDIYNRSASVVLVGGKECAPGQVVHTMATNADGWAGTKNDLLPYGSYEIIERMPPAGYLNTGIIKREFKIRTDGEIVSMKASSEPIKNNIIRGGVRVLKFDNEIDENRAQGGATLEGAVFEIVNRSADSVLVQDKLYAIGAVVYTFSTDKTGAAVTQNDLLPFGTYEVREIKPPEGYLATGVLSRMFTIREHGKIVELNASETAIKNNPIRGDLKGVKISDSDGNRMAGIPFELRSVSTDEAHIVITDQNGQFDTSSAWNPHSQNTNRGETDRDGVWFGELRTLDDGNGALLYDTYRITELPCEANKDRELLSFEVSIYRHMTTLDLGTLTNDYTQTPEIFTTAMDQETTTDNAHVSEQTTIIDTVYYAGLQNIGKEYTLKGVLMDKSTGAPLLIDGQEIRNEKTFRTLSENGSVAMEFTFNSTALADKSVVVFESLEFEGKEIASHADIEDEGQTVTFKNPQIGTSASGLMGEKELDIYPDTKIIDAVSFSGLMVDQTYTLTGKLMDKETGAPLLIDGQEVTADKSFVPKTEAGTVEMSFTVNAAALKGKAVVVFESLKYKEREIAVHADIEDNGQTVTFKDPQIGTSATGAADEKEIIAAKTATIVDTVSYKSLAIGKTYTLKGALMDKETGNPLIVDGKEITAETTFVAKEESGSVEVVFTLDAVDLAGKSIVVFESLYYGDTKIAAHADIEDEGQTVTFKTPKIGTKARAEDNGKIVPVSQSAKVIDTVSYENLVIGEEYHLKAVLMDKETGKAVLVDGKEVTAETTFVAKTVSGSVDMVFTFNTTALQGKILVVFESLEYEGKEIAAHADINDEAQTVTVGKETPPEKEPEPSKESEIGTGAQTGRDGLPLWLLIVAIGAGIAGTIIFIMWKKNSRKG